MPRRLKDYTDRKLGFLTITEKVITDGDVNWKASCACGGEIILTHKQVSSSKKSTCGCGMRTLNYQNGKVYGKLTIVEQAERLVHRGSRYRQVYCECSCGNPERVLVRCNNLISGNTTSCGCVLEASRKKHGMSRTRTYRIHEGMVRRCRPELKDKFPHHAGRGIKVCKEWNPYLGGSFENFYRDMGEAPDGMSIDRIDNDGDYCKENCRWATDSIQGYNKGLDPNNTSGKSGVSFYKSQGKWSAEIHVEGNHIRLGMFEDKEDAINARLEAELKYYGWNKE